MSKAEPKFRVGDKVILCDTDDFTYYKDMHQPGDIVTIAEILPVPITNMFAYRIEEDKYLYAEQVMKAISNAQEDMEDVICMQALNIARMKSMDKPRLKQQSHSNTIFVTDATTLLVAIRNLINSYLDRQLPPDNQQD